MSVDAVAILRIENLPPPPTPFGVNHPVTHQGDATLINLMARWDPTRADEWLLALRMLLGDDLDRHDDPRGVLLYPDVMEPPMAGGYDALIAAMERHGVWAPMVREDHMPRRLTEAAPGSHDALLAEMRIALGQEDALTMEVRTTVALVNVLARPGEETDRSYAEALEALAARMGRDFADRYDRSLRKWTEQGIANSLAPPPIILE